MLKFFKSKMTPHMKKELPYMAKFLLHMRELWNDVKCDCHRQEFEIFEYTMPSDNMTSFDSINTCLDKGYNDQTSPDISLA